MDFFEEHEQSFAHGNSSEENCCQKFTQCWRRYRTMDVSPITLHIRNKEHREKYHETELEQVRRRWNYASVFFVLLSITKLVEVTSSD